MLFVSKRIEKTIDATPKSAVRTRKIITHALFFNVFVVRQSCNICKNEKMPNIAGKATVMIINALKTLIMAKTISTSTFDNWMLIHRYAMPMIANGKSAPITSKTYLKIFKNLTILYFFEAFKLSIACVLNYFASLHPFFAPVYVDCIAFVRHWEFYYHI